jgi:nucleotide-binding universal stress UspA family protein
VGLTDDPQPCVLVGVDGGWRSFKLVTVAAEEARRRKLPLVMVTVTRPVLDPERSPYGQRLDEQQAEEMARRRLAEAVLAVRNHDAHVDVSAHVLPETVLAAGEEATLDSAALLVLGARGGYGRTAFGLDSVSRMLLTRASCPVLTVPDAVLDGRRLQPVADAPVVVGVAGTKLDAAVMRAAVAESLSRRTALRVVHAYRAESAVTTSEAVTHGLDVCAAAIREVSVPQAIPVSAIARLGDPTSVLLREVGEGSVLVIGSRGPGALAGLAADSVSRQILREAKGCVLVVPRRASPQGSGGGANGPAAEDVTDSLAESSSSG